MFVTETSLTSGTRRWDESVNMWLAEHRAGQFVSIAQWFTKLADTKSILGIMLLITIVLAVFRQWRAMLLVPLAMMIEITTFLAVNYLVGRPRPDVSKIGPIPGTYSFPSGHVAATFVCWFGPVLLLYAFGHFDSSRLAVGGRLRGDRADRLGEGLPRDASHHRRRDGPCHGNRRARRSRSTP